MWLSKKISAGRKTDGAAVGPVTMSGERVAVMSGAEKRGVSVFAPGGYIWRPGEGDSLLVMKCRGGETCAVGAETTAYPAGLLPGEVYIKSKRGAAILLKNDGGVTVTGAVHIEGGLYVNGTQIG